MKRQHESDDETTVDPDDHVVQPTTLQRAVDAQRIAYAAAQMQTQFKVMPQIKDVPDNASLTAIMRWLKPSCESARVAHPCCSMWTMTQSYFPNEHAYQVVQWLQQGNYVDKFWSDILMSHKPRVMTKTIMVVGKFSHYEHTPRSLYELCAHVLNRALRIHGTMTIYPTVDVKKRPTKITIVCNTCNVNYEFGYRTTLNPTTSMPAINWPCNPITHQSWMFSKNKTFKGMLVMRFYVNADGPKVRMVNLPFKIDINGKNQIRYPTPILTVSALMRPKPHGFIFQTAATDSWNSLTM